MSSNLLPAPQLGSPPAKPTNVKRLALAWTSLLGSLLGIWAAGVTGYSHLLSEQAMLNSLPAAANEAVRLSPSNPQAHYARGMVLLQAERLAEAAQEFERAAQLRPSDYVLWLELGRARHQNGDHELAMAAIEQATRFAPYYARPRWEIGQLLLRAGRQDEAFEQLRRASASRPALLSSVIDLAWKTSGGDVPAVQRAIQPQTSHDRLLLARFLLKHGRTDEAMQLFRSADAIPDEDRRAILTGLLDTKRFKEAHEVWSIGRSLSDGERGGVNATITDGGFENQIRRDDPGFGWQRALHLQQVSVSLSESQTHAGAYSLLLHFSGHDRPQDRIMTQLVLVEPNAGYRLSFAARTEELVTGGPPIVSVTDASDAEGLTLAQSIPLPPGTNEWQSNSVEFTTKDATEAVVIAIQRQNCTMGPCPIFGRVWFDAFSLEKLL